MALCKSVGNEMKSISGCKYKSKLRKYTRPYQNISPEFYWHEAVVYTLRRLTQSLFDAGNYLGSI